mgnify:CR=1 FL=1
MVLSFGVAWLSKKKVQRKSSTPLEDLLVDRDDYLADLASTSTTKQQDNELYAYLSNDVDDNDENEITEKGPLNWVGLFRFKV